MMTPFTDVDLPLPDRRDGKVRVSYALGDDRRLFVTTDRLSAFDRIVAGVPYKGQVLNELAAWWFERSADVVANHVVAVPDPNLLVARAATTLPVEVVVRAYITGVTATSLWRPYASGERTIYGHRFPDGLAAAGQVALRYRANPNGSVADIAGVCDPTGVVLGLMPHPENHVLPRQHPRHRHDPSTTSTLGLHLFEAAVRHVK